MYGDANATRSEPRRRRKSIAEKTQGKYQKADTGCWIWTAAFNNTGYGRLRDHPSGKMLLAHRVMYELHVGPIPEGLVLDHLCRVRACVNPSHLEPVTFAENVKRGDAVKTHCPQGHEYNAENTGKGNGGSKRCLKCHRDQQRELYHRKRNEIGAPSRTKRGNVCA